MLDKFLNQNLMKYTFLVTLVFAVFATSAIAKDKEVFKPDVDQVSNQLESDQLILHDDFKGLDALEQKIKEENLTFGDIDAETVEGLSLKEDVKGALVAVAGADDLPLGIPGFWWGFCLGLVGILLVYILMEDSPERKEQTKKAVIGALIWVGIWLLLWLVVFGSAVI